MKYKWLKSGENKKLIIFFNGWGMDECVIKHLDAEDFDILMFYDYNTRDTDFDFVLLNRYPDKYLVAWSMGVMTASLYNIDYSSKTAINGTLKPIDNKYGIPEKIYNLTLAGLTPKGVRKFMKNMYEENCDLPAPQRNFENQKSELEALKNFKANQDFKYNRIILSSNDKIIPTKNQTAFWKTEPNIKSGHAPFNLFKKWSDLL